MWPFRKKTSSHQEVEKSAAIIRDYLTLLPESGTWKDTDLLNGLVGMGHDKAHSWYVIGMIPIFAGRELMNGMGISFSSSLVLYDDRTRPSGPIKFADFPACIAISTSWPQIIAHPNYKSLCLWGPEFNCVNAMMNKGSQPSDLVLVEPGLTHPN